MLAALYAIAMLGLLGYGLNLLVLSAARLREEREERQEQSRAAGEEEHVPSTWPCVTVQVPLYNEADVAARVIDACARLDYPPRRLEVQGLDDSTDETTARVARCVERWRRRGRCIRHVRRSTRAGYKAGALKHGLATARGRLIAIFDADFVPPPDFLRRVVPLFAEAHVGMVQARWGHLNAADSLLTRLQAFGLDGHFALEQHARQAAGCFISFNGTAGIWRRRCIDEAGGWQSDTLTEDLDLSYRAQLAGWRFRYLNDLAVPAELPAQMSALRAQQFRWTKGGVETARKLLGRLWRAHVPLRVKLEGAAHLTAHFVFPLLLVAALTHAPLLWLAHVGRGPGPAYFALMAVGLVGFGGFLLAQLLAQRALYADWPRRMRLFPAYLAGTMGLALSNTRAVWQGLRGTPTAFVRTPKYARASNGQSDQSGEGARWWQSRYAQAGLAPVVWAEAALALYSALGLAGLVAAGAWLAVPFQALFALGFTLVAASSVWQARRARRRA